MYMHEKTFRLSHHNLNLFIVLMAPSPFVYQNLFYPTPIPHDPNCIYNFPDVEGGGVQVDIKFEQKF